MKAVSSRDSRQHRVEAMNDNTFLPSENASKAFPPSLIAHVSGKIDESLVFVRERFANDAEASSLLSRLSSVDGQGLLQRLIAGESIASNSKLAEAGNQLARALRVLPFDMIKSLCDVDHRHHETIRHVLDYYTAYLKKNKEIFTTITQHHQKVKETDDWSKVATNTAALKDYSVMAHAMGDKAWVLEANWWMASYVQQFFFGDASIKFARKYLTPALCRADAHAHAAVCDYVAHVRTCIDRSVQPSQQTASEDTEVATPHGVAKVLDVGSCYNPLARSPDASYLNITAIDLHPSNKALDGSNDAVDSHYHVHTCDFLTVDVNDADDIEYTTSQDDANQRVTVVQSIPRHFYHAVTMSLVLSYLPDPGARAVMVKKAYDVLQAKCGLFLIVEKDSIFKNINHPSMKSGDPRGSWPIWKRAMWRLGFACVKYEHHRHSPVSSSSMVSSCARMSHIMVFVTRNQLPDPIPLTEEPYHVKKPNPPVDGMDESKYTSSMPIEELEQLWIKQDLETAAVAVAAPAVGGHSS